MPEPPSRRPPVRGREQGSGRRAPAPRALPGSAPSPTTRSASARPRRPSPWLVGRAGPRGFSSVAGALWTPRPPPPPARRDARGRPHLPSSRAPPPRRWRAPCPRARAAALGRVRGVRWRWGRREPELSQAPRPPERAKWGVMAAGGSGCTSSAGSGGRGVSPRRTGRCVRICVWGARGGQAGVGAGRGSP